RDPAAPADRVGLVRLVDQSQRLKRLVLELLDASRLEQGSLVADCEPLDLTGLCHTLARQEATRWQRVQLDAHEPVVAEVDPPRIGQVITNLVENALKYSPPPTPVALSVWRDDGEARLSVRDQGIGIPAEEQLVVFDRFHRGGNVDDRRFAGMGLGLYIARAIVEQHGGRIWVDSAPGEGSTFHVALPLGDLERELPVRVSEGMGG
ncbi:MAG TPA: ATP-binding protein, partial [Chloroflexota bacterium]